MYVLVLETGDGEYEDYDHSIEEVFLHTQGQNAAELEKQYVWLKEMEATSLKQWLKYNKLKNTAANRTKFVESPEYSMLFSTHPKTFADFLLSKGFIKVDKFENIIW